MLDYNLIQKEINREVTKILLCIKQEYYEKMSEQNKKKLDDLIESNNVVVINKGLCKWNDNTFAHGGRALKDGKIHFYPDARNLISNEETIEKCKKILLHECFHYFIQPDNIYFISKEEKDMANFYTEGLVEKETRKLAEKYKDTLKIEKANYGYNINFVNRIQERLGASEYEIIFSENSYLKNIGMFQNDYYLIQKKMNNALEALREISQQFPEKLKRKMFNRMKTILLQEGNTILLQEKLKKLGFVSIQKIQELSEEEKDEQSK